MTDGISAFERQMKDCIECSYSEALKDEIRKNKKLEQQIENMKCCGNCTENNLKMAENEEPCSDSRGLNKCCIDHNFDNLTQKERMV